MNVVALRIAHEEKEEKQRKIASALSTLIILLALLGLLLFFGFTYLNPPPPEGGIMVAMGTPDAGMTDETPDQTTEQTTASSSNTEESFETQDFEEAPDEKPATTPNTTPKTTPTPDKPKVEPKPQVNPDFQFKPKPGDKNTNNGNNNKPGQQGEEDGEGKDPLGGDGMGTSGPGTWMMGYGRSPVGGIKASCKFQRSEKIVVKIRIDKNGNVVETTCVSSYKNSKGTLNATTVGEPYCACAKDGAKSVKFTAKADAPATQEGAILFEFKVQ